MTKVIKSTSEAKAPHSRSIEIVDKVSGCIKPDDEKSAEWASKYIKLFRDRFAFDLDYVQQYFQADKKILDVAAVPLVLTGALREAGYDVSAVDIAPERFSATVSALGVVVKKCDIEIEPLPFDGDHFDGLVFNEIFEHLRSNLIFTVGELNRVLKTDGILLVSTPNPHWFFGYMRYLFARQTAFLSASVFEEYAKIERIGHMGHVREYGSSDVISFFEDMGFTTERVIYRGWTSWLLPKSTRPFITYVFKKTGAPKQPADQDEPMKIRPWTLGLAFILAFPIVWFLVLSEKFVFSWLSRRLGVPKIR